MEKLRKVRNISWILFAFSLLIFLIPCITMDFDNPLMIVIAIISGIVYITCLVILCVVTRKIDKYQENKYLQELYDSYVQKMKEWKNKLNSKLKMYKITFMEFYENANRYGGMNSVFSKGGVSDRTSYNIMRRNNIILITNIPISLVYYFNYYKGKKYIKNDDNRPSCIFDGLTYEQVMGDERFIDELKKMDYLTDRCVFVMNAKNPSYDLSVGLVESLEYSRGKLNQTSGLELAIKSELFGTAYTLLSEYEKIENLERRKYDVGVYFLSKTHHFDIRDKAWFENVLLEFINKPI